jgi:hypothetical protein
MATLPATTHAPAPPQPQPAEQIMQLGFAYFLSSALYAVLQLRIPDLLVPGPRTADSLAPSSGAHADALHRVLRALAMVGVFAEVAPRTYALTPVSDMLRSDHPSQMREMSMFMGHPFHLNVFRELPYTLATGKPAIDKVYGMPCFEAMQSMPDVQEHFQKAMTSYSSQIAPAVLDAYDFSGVATLMDVAGGHGRTLCEILSRYPKMKGILFDMPEVVEHENCKTCILNLSGRCQRVGGNFFEQIPAGADAYYMQHILHDWDDERALKILGHVRRALAGVPNARLLVVESVVPDGPEPHPSKLLDIEMMMLPGGKERTDKEWRALFDEAGFRLARVTPTSMPKSVLEARPQ